MDVLVVVLDGEVLDGEGVAVFPAEVVFVADLPVEVLVVVLAEEVLVEDLHGWTYRSSPVLVVDQLPCLVYTTQGQVNNVETVDGDLDILPDWSPMASIKW